MEAMQGEGSKQIQQTSNKFNLLMYHDSDVFALADDIMVQDAKHLKSSFNHPICRNRLSPRPLAR